MKSPMGFIRRKLAAAFDEQDWVTLWCIPALGAWGYAVLRFGLQIYHYLQTGEWMPFTGLTAVCDLWGTSWCSQPENWLGVWDILDTLNGSLVLIFAGIALAVPGLIAAYATIGLIEPPTDQ